MYSVESIVKLMQFSSDWEQIGSVTRVKDLTQYGRASLNGSRKHKQGLWPFRENNFLEFSLLCISFTLVLT